ncbi:hypothetical protein [Natranaeroarchaeum sulfidigenes]|uniref:Uncharacterized protein n=1 Tax=Natranaeroarchaeum sulfidigenes TaxID=2784880 RepID=A0A897MLB2_9EURY|nr:hypothetical protein [Natranaeroarchaeum sulfidigenes]QSG01374.1 hypothetical protein AArcS_0134 [Natranaeroarchaeum sulfidigenes]
MIESNAALVRNLSVYAVGVGMAVAGALGIAAAIELSLLIAWPLFIAGLALVLVVHEYLGGPV